MYKIYLNLTFDSSVLFKYYYTFEGYLMKQSIKHISFILIFLGIFLSCFQFTIIHLSKNYKFSSIEISSEDGDDHEDDSKEKKFELKDEYCFSEFNPSFASGDNSKTALLIKLLNLKQSPVLGINTPPPKK